MSKTITLLKDTGKHLKGDVFRVWEEGQAVTRGVVDPQRAAQWIKDGFAKPGEATTQAEREVEKAERVARRKAPRKAK